MKLNVIIDVDCEMPRKAPEPSPDPCRVPRRLFFRIIYNSLGVFTHEDKTDSLPFRFHLIRRPTSNHDSRLHPTGDARRAAFQIHPVHRRLPLPALADQVPKIPPRHLALLPDRSRLVAGLAELLDASLQPRAQGLGRVPEDLAHLRRDAGAVGVRVIERREGVSDASREPGG